MRYTWDEAKRSDNLREHGLDFVDAEEVFAGPTFTYEDDPRRQSMSKRSSSRKSRTEWARVRAMKDRDIKVSVAHPEASTKHIVRGIVRQGLNPVPPKAAISLRLDVDVLQWFKSQGPGYQTRINAILRAYKKEAA